MHNLCLAIVGYLSTFGFPASSYHWINLVVHSLFCITEALSEDFVYLIPL